MKLTKTLAVVLALALACSLLSACGAENGKDSIVGTWISEDFDGAFIYIFNDDGTGNYNAMGMDMPFTYTAEDGKLSILFNGDGIPLETSYTVSGKILTVRDILNRDVVYNKK